MASAIVASTSATTTSPTSSTTAAVARSSSSSDEGDPIGAASSRVGGGGNSNNNNNSTVSFDVEVESGGPDTVDRRSETTSLIGNSSNSNSNDSDNDNDNNHSQQQHEQDQEQMQSSQPLSEKIRSDKTIDDVGSNNNYNATTTKIVSLSSSSLRAAAAAANNNNDADAPPAIPRRTVATTTTSSAGKQQQQQPQRFGEGPLPRELRRIIMEVAKTGKCSWLSWNQEATSTKSLLLNSSTSKRKGGGMEAAASTSSNGGSETDPTSASVSNSNSKSASLAKVASSSSSSYSSQYSPSFANNKGSSSSSSSSNTTAGSGGGVVRKQPSFNSGGTSTITNTSTAARRSTATGLPPRKRHRNGVVHKSGGERMRFGSPDGGFGRTNNVSSNSRKRPLVFVRTNSSGTTVSTSTTTSGNNNSSNNNSNTNNNSNNNSNMTNTNMSSTSSKLNNSNLPHAALSSSALLHGGLFSSAPSSVGSGRSTGSEPDYDSAQYECDSEGTSATSNSEISSARKTTRAKRSGAANTQGAHINSGLDTWTDTATVCDGEDETNSMDGTNAIPVSPYKTLQTAFRGALGLVLDHFYQNRDNGYKLSPAENRRNERFAETLNRNSNNNNTDDCNDADPTMKSDKLSSLFSSEYVFQQRRQRLMAMLLPTISQAAGHEKDSEEPPFTMQRIAEVLVAPNRTHKLCNCLEKLLLVNSSTDSFGGSTGGDTSQRQREERELAALADEKGRQEVKLRQLRLANTSSKSPFDEFVADDTTDPFSTSSRSSSNSELMPDESGTQNPSSKARSGSLAVRSEKETMTTNNIHSTSREILDALARASLRTRFDHVGTESQQHDNVPNTANERDVRAIAENRRMTNSPPLPGLNNMARGVASGPNISVASTSHGDTNGYVRQHLSEQQQHQNEEHDLAARVTSPILFSPGNESNLETTATNMNMLQFHHAVALAGVSLNRPNHPSPLDNLMTIDASTISQMRSHANTTGAGPGSESTDGRSSASNSDIDSESDDISFDDSASDRSDGSDSGSTCAHHEPFTAARAMALNRMQQQQRLQSRVLTSLSHQGEGFRPPADSEYQSGDSIDSTRAEDSGGSDSSF